MAAAGALNVELMEREGDEGKKEFLTIVFFTFFTFQRKVRRSAASSASHLRRKLLLIPYSVSVDPVERMVSDSIAADGVLLSVLSCCWLLLVLGMRNRWSGKMMKRRRRETGEKRIMYL